MNTQKKDIKTIKDYKSSPSRTIQSLGLANYRLKDKNDRRKSEIKRLCARIDDLEESRDAHKMKNKELKKQLDEALERCQSLEEKKSRSKLKK